MAEGSLAIGATLGVHLEQTKIDAELNFFLTILADKLPHHHLARVVIPVFQEVGNVEIHGLNMAGAEGQVNAP